MKLTIDNDGTMHFEAENKQDKKDIHSLVNSFKKYSFSSQETNDKGTPKLFKQNDLDQIINY
ncbi:hypothetical protein [Parabacteroides leei]|uniref:hypothetical protein n=1 Tax=Parabacteroides leei TaxID=2939491 RepID=UPI001898AF29|nr:hypothetical protein [Parabacteroides goldsteinii]